MHVLTVEAEEIVHAACATQVAGCKQLGGQDEEHSQKSGRDVELRP